MIQVKSFTKKYGNHIAVQDVSFQVLPGQVTGLLGPNGAGKTTILKGICTLHYATQGTIYVQGLDVAKDPVKVRQIIGYVSEQPALISSFTTEEFLNYAASIRFSKTMESVFDAVQKVSVQCDLQPVMKTKISNLSKGYRQRLSFAQSLLHNPSVLILDEPVSGLDPAQIRQMRSLIKELAKDHTVLLSTHLMQEVEALCSTVHIISDGRLVASGTAQQITTQEKCNTFEDAFLKLTSGFSMGGG